MDRMFSLSLTKVMACYDPEIRVVVDNQGNGGHEPVDGDLVDGCVVAWGIRQHRTGGICEYGRSVLKKQVPHSLDSFLMLDRCIMLYGEVPCIRSLADVMCPIRSDFPLWIYQSVVIVAISRQSNSTMFK